MFKVDLDFKNGLNELITESLERKTTNKNILWYMTFSIVFIFFMNL
jgi:hypothetical protein